MNVEAGNDKAKSAGSNKLSIWGYDPTWLNYGAEMKKKFPNIELEFIDQTIDITNDFLNKAAEGNAPDVVMLKAEYRSIGKLHYMDVFDDLLSPPLQCRGNTGSIRRNTVEFRLIT